MFSVLLIVALVLVHLAIGATPSDGGIWLTNQTHRKVVLVTLGLILFAAIACLWCIACYATIWATSRTASATVASAHGPGGAVSVRVGGASFA